MNILLQKVRLYLNDVLNEGAKKARLLAQEKILAIKEIIGISKIN